jgi:fructose-1,6-bisphosphatase/inositol monophosphatase family enzyme
MSEFENELQLAKNIAYEAGKIMKKYFLQSKTEWKSDNTPVTKADIEINSMVIERIKAKYPDHSIYGEEEQAIVEGSRYTWVCDPVDGTLPYSRGLPISSFSLALCDDGKPMVGVVYDPFMDRLFWAEQGGGAFCNDEPIRVNSDSLEHATINIEGNGSARQILNFSPDFVDKIWGSGAKLTTMWTTVLPTAMVTNGNFTASIFNVWKPEDGAATRIIVEEAGGRFTSLKGEDRRYDEVGYGYIASNGVVHDELLDIIKKASKESSNWGRRHEI